MCPRWWRRPNCCCRSTTWKSRCWRWPRRFRKRNTRGDRVRACAPSRRSCCTSCTAIDAYLDANAAVLEGQPAEHIRAKVRKFVEAEIAAGRLILTPPTPTPWGERIGNVVHLIGSGLLILLLSPVALVLLVLIRLRENTEPVYAPRPDRDQAKALADIEDYEFTNQFSAMGSWKPGLVRRWMGRYILLVIDWTARHW